MGFAIPVIGVLIFSGLTVYDTQRIKSQYFMVQARISEIQEALQETKAVQEMKEQVILSFISLSARLSHGGLAVIGAPLGTGNDWATGVVLVYRNTNGTWNRGRN